MESLVRASGKAIGSIFAPGMLGVFVKSLLLTVAALIGFVILMTWGAAMIAGHIANPEWAASLPWLSGIGASVIAWMFFPGIMPIIVNFFDTRIIHLIEQHEYPGAPRAQEPPFWPELRHDIKFSLSAVALNIIALPFYLLPLVNVFLFYGLNGYLLGKEFFVTVARQHMPVADAVALRRRHGRRIFAAGIILTVLATIPFVNLLAPFWGVAVMTHLYQGMRVREESAYRLIDQSI